MNSQRSLCYFSLLKAEMTVLFSLGTFSIGKRLPVRRNENHHHDRSPQFIGKKTDFLQPDPLQRLFFLYIYICSRPQKIFSLSAQWQNPLTKNTKIEQRQTLPKIMVFTPECWTTRLRSPQPSEPLRYLSFQGEWSFFFFSRDKRDVACCFLRRVPVFMIWCSLGLETLDQL